MNIRPALEQDIPSLAKVHVESWRTTYRGIVADSFLANLSYQKHEERHRRYIAQSQVVYFLAELTEAGVVGFLSGGPERSGDAQFSSELYAIYLLAEHQRRGIGAQLVREWACSIISAGKSSGLVWVLADNAPARRFYERLGGQPMREEILEIGGQPLKEIAYGWKDLSLISNG